MHLNRRATHPHMRTQKHTHGTGPADLQHVAPPRASAVNRRQGAPYETLTTGCRAYGTHTRDAGKPLPPRPCHAMQGEEVAQRRRSTNTAHAQCGRSASITREPKPSATGTGLSSATVSSPHVLLPGNATPRQIFRARILGRATRS